MHSHLTTSETEREIRYGGNVSTDVDDGAFVLFINDEEALFDSADAAWLRDRLDAFIERERRRLDPLATLPTDEQITAVLDAVTAETGVTASLDRVRARLLATYEAHEDRVFARLNAQRISFFGEWIDITGEEPTS